MPWKSASLPEGPPPLNEQITLSSAQLEAAQLVANNLSEGLEGIPVVLSQDGAVVAAGGGPESLTERLARHAARAWMEGATSLARELIRFEEEIPEESPERVAYLLYSAHVIGALTLSVGWQMSASLTQLRAEVSDAVSALRIHLSR